MTTISYTTTDNSKLAGIKAAMARYNATLPDVMDVDGKTPVSPKPGTLADIQDYFQMIADGWAVSYAKQFDTDVTEIDAKIADLQERKAELMADSK